MIEADYGRIAVLPMDVEGECQLRFLSDFNEQFAYLCRLNEKGIKHLISELQYAQKKIDEWKETYNDVVKRTNFSKLYNEFEKRYNPYPIQMSYASAFGHALDEGLIDEQTYKVARIYFGRMWNYVGD